MKKRATWVQNALVRRKKLPTQDSTAQREVRKQMRIDDRVDARVGVLWSIGVVGEKLGQGESGIGVTMGGVMKFMAGDAVLGALGEGVAPA